MKTSIPGYESQATWPLQTQFAKFGAHSSLTRRTTSQDPYRGLERGLLKFPLKFLVGEYTTVAFDPDSGKWDRCSLPSRVSHDKGRFGKIYCQKPWVDVLKLQRLKEEQKKREAAISKSYAAQLEAEKNCDKDRYTCYCGARIPGTLSRAPSKRSMVYYTYNKDTLTSKEKTTRPYNVPPQAILKHDKARKRWQWVTENGVWMRDERLKGKPFRQVFKIGTPQTGVRWQDCANRTRTVREENKVVLRGVGETAQDAADDSISAPEKTVETLFCVALVSAALVILK